MSAPKDLYPFATQDGKAIPLDIIRADGLIFIDYTLAGELLTIPAGKEVGTVYASTDAILTFGANTAVPAANVPMPASLFIPAKTILTVALLPGSAYVKAMSTNGKLVVQLIEKWAGLGLTTQFARK